MVESLLMAFLQLHTKFLFLVVGEKFEVAAIDQKQQALLAWYRKVGIQGKSQFALRHIKFKDNTITDQGLKTDTSWIPVDERGVACFQAMVNYLARFVPQNLEIMAPIRPLVKSNVANIW